jgi:D-glycero-alpha-D-manno-heptose-7-phosphate kinase
MTSRNSRLPNAVLTATPLRISFVGGGTDLPAYYEKHGGAVISSAIDKYIYVTVKRHSPLFQEAYRLSYSKTEHVQSLDDIENDIARECLRLVPVAPPLYLSTAADLPANSGLGSSSSFTVGLLHALHLLKGERVSAAQLAEEACEVEINILGNPIGKQDQYAAAFGGLNHLSFKKHGRVEVDHLFLPHNLVDTIFNNSLLIWTGIGRSASAILKKQSDHIDQKVQEYGYLSSAANALKELILQPPENFLASFGALLEKTWSIKKQLEGSITSDEIDLLHQQIRGLGSYGGKLSGAGGGGFLYEIVKECDHEALLATLGPERVVQIAHEPQGSRILSELF